MRIQIIIAIIISTVTCSWAQEAQEQVAALTARKCFVDAPDNIIPLIEKGRRLDMMDYFDAQSGKGSPNIYGNECIVESNVELPDLSNSLLQYRTDTDLAYSIFVVNGASATPLIGIIEEIPTPIPETSLKFYTKTWSAPKVKVWNEPVLTDWLINKADRDEVAETLPFIMYSISYDVEKQLLTLSHNMTQYFVQGDGDSVLSKLKPKLMYRWNGKQFKQINR